MCACHTDRYCIDGSWRDDDIDTVVRTLLHLPELQRLLRLIATIEMKDAFCVLDHGPEPQPEPQPLWSKRTGEAHLNHINTGLLRPKHLLIDVRLYMHQNW